MVATYTIEHAKTGRSKCKRCKTPIEKNDLRMGVSTKNEERGFEMTTYYHVGCFRLPRKFATGSTKISTKQFIEDEVTDTSDDHSILPKQLHEIVDSIENNSTTTTKTPNTVSSSTSTKKRSSSSIKMEKGVKMPSNINDKTLIGKLTIAYLQKTMKEEEDDDDERPKKKVKKIKKEQNYDNWDQMVEIYSKYHKAKIDDIKEVLRWNRQTLTGNKSFLQFKVLDGELNGRLGVCALCGGRLKLVEDENGDDGYEVACNGRFDEDMNVRVPCDYRCNSWKSSKVPRIQPFYIEEPTEEQKEEMDKIIEDGKNMAESSQGGANGSSNSAKEENDEMKRKLLSQVKKHFDDDENNENWDLSNKNGIKQGTTNLVEFLQNNKKYKIDLPTDTKKCKMAIGSIVLNNKDKSPSDIVELVINKYGFREVKAKQAAEKEAIAEGVCEHPKNAPIVLAFQELSKLYLKEGNANASGAYRRSANAVKALTFEVTADNAMGLSKGKTKVQNIGKGSAEKMKEFCETGTMAKLEEKRANAE